MSIAVYVLKLINNKYYIGISCEYKKRIETHFKNKGSKWTRLHYPISVVEIKNNIQKTKEKETTLDYMRQFGWQNVRGSYWCRRLMLNPPKCL